MNSPLKALFSAVLLSILIVQAPQASTHLNGENITSAPETLHMPGFWETGVIKNDPANVYKLSKATSPLVLDHLTYRFQNKDIAIIDTINASSTLGLLVLQENQIHYEKYFDEAIANDGTVDKDPNGDIEKSLFPSYSVGKSITSSAIGLAIADKSIASIDDPVDKYATSLKKSGYAGVSIRNVLNMSSGVYFDEGYGPVSGIAAMLAYLSLPWNNIDGFIGEQKQRIENFTPGDYYNYSSLDPAALASVLRGATKQKMTGYLQEKLWKKAGMESHANVQIDNAKLELGFCCIKATLRDYGRYGLIYANAGTLQGQQILPKTWVDMSTQTVSYPKGMLAPSETGMGYGNQWWIPKDNAGDFLAVGLYGQFIYVDPEHDVVIVKTSQDVEGEAKNKLYVDQMLSFFRSIRNELLVQS